MSVRKKKRILHVGTGKTGTSFIQETLAANPATLARHGILYPSTGRHEVAAGHHKFHSALASSKEWWMPEASSPESALGAMLAEISEKNPDIVIISQEALVWLPPATVHRLGVTFAEFDVKIVIDFRRQDLYVDSALNQVVKAAGHKYSFEQLWRFDGSWFVPNYFELVDKWARTFGPASIVVRPFERSQVLGANILDDLFIRVLGYTVPIRGVDSNMTTNDRLCRQCVEFQRLMNWLFAENPQVTREFSTVLSTIGLRHGWDQYSILSDDVRKRIIKATQPHNKAISDAFNYDVLGTIGLKDGLFIDPFKPSAENQYEGLSDEDAAVIVRYLKELKPELVSTIEQAPGLANLEASDRQRVERIKSLF